MLCTSGAHSGSPKLVKKRLLCHVTGQFVIIFTVFFLVSSLIALRCTWRYWCRCLVTSAACDGPSSVPSVSVMKWFLLKPFAFHCSSVSYESPWESVEARELSLPLKICCQDSKPEGEDWPWQLGPWQWNLGDSTFCVTDIARQWVCYLHLHLQIKEKGELRGGDWGGDSSGEWHDPRLGEESRGYLSGGREGWVSQCSFQGPFRD